MIVGLWIRQQLGCSKQGENSMFGSCGNQGRTVILGCGTDRMQQPKAKHTSSRLPEALWKSSDHSAGRFGKTSLPSRREALRAVRLGTRPCHDRLSPSTQRAQSRNVNRPDSQALRQSLRLRFPLPLGIWGNTFGYFSSPQSGIRESGTGGCKTARMWQETFPQHSKQCR